MAEPKIRFRQEDGSSYPAWQEVTLGNIASRVTRKNIHNETDRPLTIASIEGLVDQRSYFGKTIASKDMSGYFLLKNGEFAYNKSYSAGYDYGSIKRLDKYDMGALSTLYICFALNESENSDFYNCYFNGLSWYSQMQAICAEGARNHGLLNVSPSDFFKICLHVPSSAEEQGKIADFLSSIDEVIAVSEQEVANLETQKKAVMKKIFSQEVRFKREDGTDFPEWEQKKLGDVGTVLMCKRVFKEQTGDKGDIPFYKIGTFGGTPDAFISRDLFENLKSKYSYPKKGNILLSAAGTIGRAVVYNGEDAYYQDSNIVWLDHDDTLMDDYLFQFYAMTTWDNLEGGTVKRLYNGLLLDKDISIPSVEEQCLIADFLSEFDEAISAAKKELELWKEMKKGLLQQMFV